MRELMLGFAERFRSEHGLAVDFFIEDRNRPLPDRLCRELFQIYSESLHNVKKHADASHVVVKLKQDEAKVFLVVDDNGRGFSFSGSLCKRGVRPAASGANFNQGTHTKRWWSADCWSRIPGTGHVLPSRSPSIKMTKAKQAIRILVADDHAIFRDGLRKLLEAADDVTIVGEASNGVECTKMLAKLKPDILLLDLRMPEKDGLGVLEEVNFDSPPTRVIVLTAAEDDRDVVRAMRLGARGVVLKQSASDLLLKSIRKVLRRRNLAR